MNLKVMLSLSDLAKKSVTELTLDDLSRVTSAFGMSDIIVSQDLRNAALAFLQGKNIHEVADLVQSPEAVAELLNLLRGRGKQQNEDEGLVHQCRFCGQFQIIN